jgi:transcriptional regulator with XRE-family HTH domain
MKNMYNNKAVATNIRNARLFRNYSQEYLGLKLKISQNAYSKIELGMTRIGLERILMIADILEVDILELIDMEQPFNPMKMAN